MIHDLFNVPAGFGDSELCYREMRTWNKSLYKLWFIIELLIHVFVIGHILYYLFFIPSESEKLGYYLYIGLYLLMILFSVFYLRIFNNEQIELKKYEHYLDVFLAVNMIWMCIVSCMDIYHTKTISTFIDGTVAISILYLRPKKFIIGTGIATFIYCIFIFVVMAESPIDRFNLIFNMVILMITIICFNNIKYKAKVSDIYKTVKLRELANLDSLTGLYNRLALTNYIHDANRIVNEVVAVMIDIDDFKNINDQYGHLMGDKCLNLVGKRISNYSGAAYRYGGEEFLILYEDVEKKKIVGLMEQLQQEIKEASKDYVEFTVSIGISEKCSSDNIEKIIDQADQMMYCAKQLGKNELVSYKAG